MANFYVNTEIENYPQCPKCGSEDIGIEYDDNETWVAEGDKPDNLLAVEWYVCEDCEHKLGRFPQAGDPRLVS